MAYRKISRPFRAPVTTRESTSSPEQEVKDLKKFNADLSAALTLYMSDLTNIVNDLVSGYINILQLQKQTSAPISPVSGNVAYADGTSWNPGAGEGIYGYYGGAWNKL